MVKSINKYGFDVAKYFFLNPIQWNCFADYTPSESNEELKSSESNEKENSDHSYCKSRTKEIEQVAHTWNEAEMKVNDLQNFIFQNTKYLLLNYPEYGKDIENIELELIDIHKNSWNMLESEKLMLEKISILQKWKAIKIDQNLISEVVQIYTQQKDSIMVNREETRSPDK